MSIIFYGFKENKKSIKHLKVWSKPELIIFCKENSLFSSGSKERLLSRISVFLKGKNDKANVFVTSSRIARLAKEKNII